MAENTVATENIDLLRKAEHEKYERAYQQERYHMGERRQAFAKACLQMLPSRGSYLDVSCGRGEMLHHARSIGFGLVHGSEIVPALLGDSVSYAEVHGLPFLYNEFETVSLFDVIEHLIPGDDELACKELLRVASRHILISANNLSSTNGAGEELHINRRPYQEWDGLFREWFAGHEVRWLHMANVVSPTWLINVRQESGS